MGMIFQNPSALHPRRTKLVQLNALLLLPLVAFASACSSTQLVGRAVLPAETFASGPTSGQYLGDGPINGQHLPFDNAQPVQGFSGILESGDGSFLALSDNGFGALENSADYHLRVYRIRPDFETSAGGSGTIEVIDFIELHDPDHHLPFTITNELSDERLLTGADLDIESFQRAPDGTLWFGDEFGPFLVHTDDEGRLLEPPYSFRDLRHEDRDLRSPGSPLSEEASAVRIMNAVSAHARSQGNMLRPSISPWEAMLVDGDVSTYVEGREHPTKGASILSSEIFDIESLQSAGYEVIPWTVNETNQMRALLELGVDGIITDYPNRLREVLEGYDGNGDGRPDFLDDEGYVARSAFDAQGHRGARGLRPENTLPAFEAALDSLMTTLELDVGVTADGVLLLSHERLISSALCREVRVDEIDVTDEVDQPLIRRLTAQEIQDRFVCDRLRPNFPEQDTTPELSPATMSFSAERRLPHPYVPPTLKQVVDFVEHYGEYYRHGEGSAHPDAERRWRAAAGVHFNIELKRHPLREEETVDAAAFAEAAVNTIDEEAIAERAVVQSFDFSCLFALQERSSEIRTSYLVYDSTLSAPDGMHSPWLSGLAWPYRQTSREHAFRVQQSGGPEGMALTADGERLLVMIEKPLLGDPERTLLIYEFDLNERAFTGSTYRYMLDERATSIGDFIMFDEIGGLVIERDDSEGDLTGFKVIYEIELGGPGEVVTKMPLVNLLDISDPQEISGPTVEGDIGIGEHFAFPFFTIEGIVVLDERRILVANDNNFPLSVGRHIGTSRPDDSELIVIELERELY